jgi:SAM-dependent methyltransferase
MYDAEDRLWWYLGMEKISRAVIERFYPRGSRLRILDAGCGTGGSTRYLNDYGRVTGLDFSSDALELAALRGLTLLVQASVTSLPFAPKQFDLIASFDVLCTLGPDDQLALKEFHRSLVPNGRLFLRLPAYDWLRGAHDRAVDIRQRYAAGSVSRLLLKAGFHLEHLSYANTLMFPIAVMKRWSERFRAPQKASDLSLDPGSLNPILTCILSSEAKYVANRGMPFGLTVIAVARRV